MSLTSQLAIGFVLAFAGALAATPERAQAQSPQERRAEREQRRAEKEAQRQQQRQANRQGGQRQGQGRGNLRGMEGLPPRWVERLEDMTPEAQERFMQNNERFKNLPPERQAQIRRHLQHWNSLTPQQRDEIRKGQEIWETLSPEAQEHLKNDVLPKWQQLPMERRQAIRAKLRQLNGLSDSEREEKLNDPSFTQGLNPNERELLRELSSASAHPQQDP